MAFSLKAQEFQIKVKGIETQLSCENSGDHYFCRNGDKYLYVKANGPWVSAYGNLNDQGKDEIVQIEKIQDRESEQVIYEAMSGYGGYGGGGIASGGFPGSGMGVPANAPGLGQGMAGLGSFQIPKPKPNYSTQLMNHSLLEGMIDPPTLSMFGGIGLGPEVEDSPEFLKFKKWVLKRNEHKKEEILKKFLGDDYEVELDNGKKLKCKRASTLKGPKDAYTQNLESQLGYEVKCGVFECGKDDQGNKLVLFSNGNFNLGFNDLLTISPEGFVNGPKLRKIFSSKDKLKPLVELPEMTGSFTYPGFHKPEISNEQMLPTELENQSDFFNKLNMPNYEMAMAETGLRCDASGLGYIAKARDSFEGKLTNANLVQYISASNDILSGYYLSPENIPGYACHENGVYFNPEYFQETQKVQPLQSPKVISMDKAKELFDMAKEMEDIAWDFKMDGCYARAHLMARRFEEQGVHVDKAWLKGNLFAKQDDGSAINWNFHVAPVVYVKDAQGEVKKMVIDPSIEDGPVPAMEWANKLSEQVPGGIHETKFPYPKNSILMRRASLAFSNSDPYMPYDPIGMSEEQKLVQSEDTMRRYKGAVRAESSGTNPFSVF